jgi:pimeloyl-ACP methyl ester carboxylesterase
MRALIGVLLVVLFLVLAALLWLLARPVSHPLAYLMRGGGPTVVFIAGPGDTREVWKELMPRLTGGTPGYVLDLPGTGAEQSSRDLPVPATFGELAEGAWRDLERAGQTPPYRLAALAGDSVLALALYRAHPDAVTKVILLDPTPPAAFKKALPAADEPGIGREEKVAREYLALYAEGAARLPFKALMKDPKVVAIYERVTPEQSGQ